MTHAAVGSSSPAVVAVVALGITAWNLDGAWDARRDALDARNAARAELADLRATLASQQRPAASRARRTGSAPAGARRRHRPGPAAQRPAHRHEGQPRRRHQRPQREERRGRRGTAVHRRRQRRARLAPAPRHRGDDRSRCSSSTRPCRAAQAAQGGPTPRYGFDFPDPFVLVAGTDRYAFATNSSGGNIQVLHRQPDGAWTTAGEALGRFPDWAAWGRTWAPSVLPRLGGYVMYYTVRESVDRPAVRVPRDVARARAAPTSTRRPRPLVCGPREALDPEATVAADGTPVLLWKRERPAAIVAQPLTPDGLALAGTEHELLRANQRWEDTNVEAPSMLVTGDGAWLFFSGGNWNGGRLRDGCRALRRRTRPVRLARPRHRSCPRTIASPDRAARPCSRTSPGTFGLAYHAYVSPNVGYPASRLLFTATIDLRSGHPAVVD